MRWVMIANRWGIAKIKIEMKCLHIQPAAGWGRGDCIVQYNINYTPHDKRPSCMVYVIQATFPNAIDLSIVLPNTVGSFAAIVAQKPSTNIAIRTLFVFPDELRDPSDTCRLRSRRKRVSDDIICVRNELKRKKTASRVCKSLLLTVDKDCARRKSNTHTRVQQTV